MLHAARLFLVPALLLAAVPAGCGSIEKKDPGGDGADDADDPGDAGGDGEGDADDGDDPGDGGDPGDDSGDGGEPAPTELCIGESGTRLRRLIRQHDDGTAEATALRDTEIGGNCVFQIDRGGALRCLPVLDGLPFVHGQRYYTDAGCSNAIAQLYRAPLATPTHAAFVESGACSPGFRYFQLGAQVGFGEGAVMYYRSENGACTETTPSTSSDYRYFAVAAELPPSRFVEGIDSYTDDGRLQVRRVIAADGASICDETRMRDTALDGATCYRDLAEDGVARCLPDSYGVTRVSTNSGCGAQVDSAQVSPTCGGDVDFLRSSVAGCRFTTRIRRLGSPLPGPHFVDTTDGCDAAPTGTLFFAPGDDVDPANLAPLAHERVSLGARLERIDQVGDGARLATRSWFDTELGAECRFLSTADGATRCVPTTPEQPQASVTDFYLDPACEGNTVTRAFYADACETNADPIVIVRYLGSGFRLFEIGQPVAEQHYEFSNGGCNPLPATTRLFTIGPERPLTSLVAGTESVE